MTHFVESEPVSWATQVISQLAYTQISYGMCYGDCTCAQIINFHSLSLTWLQAIFECQIYQQQRTFSMETTATENLQYGNINLNVQSWTWCVVY